MDIEQVLALYDVQERRGGEHPSYRRETTPEVVRYVSRDPSRLSFITYSLLTADNADQIIQREIDYFQANGGLGFEWKTYDHDKPDDLKARLAAHGLTGDEREALLMLDLADCPDVYLQPVTIDVRKVGKAELADVVAVQAAVYETNFDWLEKQLNQNLADAPDYWSIYAAYVDEKAVCAAWISLPENSQFAGLWGGATLPNYRKQGIYTAVVAARAQEALKRGYRYLTVDASDMSRPILIKRGFQVLTYTTPFAWKNPDFRK